VKASFEVFSQLGQMTGRSLSGVYGRLPSKNQTNKQTMFPQTKSILPLPPNHRHQILSSLTKKGLCEAYGVIIRHGLYLHSHETDFF